MKGLLGVTIKEMMEAEMDGHPPDFQIFCVCQEGHIHGQCGWTAESPIPEAEAPEKRISKRYTPISYLPPPPCFCVSIARKMGSFQSAFIGRVPYDFECE